MLKTLVLVYAMVVGVNGTSIIGSVKDGDNDKKLSNVQIIINVTDTIYSDSTGTFKLNLKEEYLESVELNYPDYETKKYVYVQDEEKEAVKKKKNKKGDD